MAFQPTSRRALRRHHRARLFKVRSTYNVTRFWHDDVSDLVRHQAIARAVTTPAACSCWMCGNPRRRQGELTLAERRVAAAQNDGVRAWEEGDA